MLHKVFTVSVYILHVVWSSGAAELNQKTWEYSLVSIDGNSTNEDLLSWSLKAEQLGRGEYAITGSMDIKVDFGDKQFTEAKIYRSATGGKEYKILPFKLEKMTLKKFMATNYKKFVMVGFKECSNFPQTEGEDLPELEKKRYTFNKCKINTDNMPSYMMPGYYKIDFFGYGIVDNVVEMIVKIEPKS